MRLKISALAIYMNGISVGMANVVSTGLIWRIILRRCTRIINYNVTSHELARELLSKPDGFITAMCDGKEYVIGNMKRVTTHANMDDSVMHWTLQLKECEGNIIR